MQRSSEIDLLGHSNRDFSSTFLFLGLASSLEHGKTPIAKELDHFIVIISAVAGSFGVVLAIAGTALGFSYLETSVLCIGVIVGNVPEGARDSFVLE